MEVKRARKLTHAIALDGDAQSRACLKNLGVGRVMPAQKPFGRAWHRRVHCSSMKNEVLPVGIRAGDQAPTFIPATQAKLNGAI
jgi:hypothetical protein